MKTVLPSANAIRHSLLCSKSSMPAFKLDGALTPKLMDDLQKMGIRIKYLGSKSLKVGKLTMLQDYVRVWKM